MKAFQAVSVLKRFSQQKSSVVGRFKYFSTENVAAPVIPTIVIPEEPVPPVASGLQNVLKPKEVVEQLNKYIVGQPEAKRAVAIALRNRWRRQQLSDDLRNEVIPKNILMIGPTGCGKTEIARRIAKLSEAPFIKVEATKFTEVGFHGKDVDQIIRDLVEVSITMTKKKLKEQVKDAAAAAAEEKILTCLVGVNADASTMNSFREQLKAGLCEDIMIDIDLPPKADKNDNKAGGPIGIAFDANSGTFAPNDLFGKLKVGFNGSGKKKDIKRMKVSEARPLAEEAEAERLLEDFDVTKEAITAVEESGIVFIDEIDKIVSSGDYRGADASSEGVQRDLLPLIEGSSISTKHGNVNTDFILFIASGAFHSAKPSDLLAELQGRLPIRVNLQGLTEDDMYRILTEPVTNLIRQQIALIKSEDVTLSFTEPAIREIARVAFLTNRTVENIGARRLHTVIERVMEEISFDAAEKQGENVVVTDEYVKRRVSDLMLSQDMRKYIL